MKTLQEELRKALEKELGNDSKSWLDEKLIIITPDNDKGKDNADNI